jgi:hypothetical protein
MNRDQNPNNHCGDICGTSLNMAAFAKILQKYERVVWLLPALLISYLGCHDPIRSTTVSESHCLSSSHLDQSSGHLALATQTEIDFEYSEHARCLHFSRRLVFLGVFFLCYKPGRMSFSEWTMRFSQLLLTIVAMRFVSRLRVFQLLWSGRVLFSYDGCWGLVQVTGLFIAQSYMHHVDRADINSSEKVDDSCSWSARSILQLLRQLMEGLVWIGRQLGKTFETYMIYKLEKMWTSESVQFAWIWQMSQLMGKVEVTFA